MRNINTNSKNKVPLLLILLSAGGIFLFQYLTFIPEYSSAVTTIETTTPVTLPTIEGTITTKFGTEELGYKTYMQEIDLAYCEKLPNLTTGQLADGRDGKIYWVTKLAGTCWMTQDLDLDLGPDGPELTTKNDGDNLYKGSQTTWDGARNVKSSESGWGSNIDTDLEQIKWWDRNSGVNSNGPHKAEHNFMGNLYSYETATAGTGSEAWASGSDAEGSICAAGWKLPIGNQYNNTTGSFMSLGMSGLTREPYYFQYGGDIDGSLGNLGSNGYYWSATNNSNSAFYLDINSNRLLSARRYVGMSIRCVIRDPNYTAPIAPKPSTSDINDPAISVTIPKVLTLDVTNSVNIETNPNNISTGTFTASVTSNANYSISLNATSEDASATSLVNIKDNKKVAEIPTITSTTQPTIGTSSWGIRKCNNLTTETCIENYKPLPTKNSTTGNPFLTSTPGNHQHLFQIGIGIGPELPSGTYTTSITVTASQN